MITWILADAVRAVALGLTLMAIVLGSATILLSVVRARRDRRRKEKRDVVREELLDRLFEPDPQWDEWVNQLSSAERRELCWVLDAYLRRFRGAERESLCTLADALGIPDNARENLASGRGQFRSLTWLAALGEPIDYSVLETHCTDTPRERAAAARLLYETASDVEAAGRRGTDILVGDGSEPLSVFGLDTLYRLNRGAATPLLSNALAAADTWSLRFRIQVLIVLRVCHADAPDEHFEWILPLVSHESPRLRTAATLALEQHGRRPALREEIEVDDHFADPSLSVRQATYYALTAWGDENAAQWLKWALFTEQNQRGLLTVVRALATHPRVDSLSETGAIAPYQKWVRAEREVGRYYRRASEDLLWS